MQKFLIIQTAFLGDVILATPVCNELKRLFPHAQIDFLVRKGNEGIISNHPSINTIYTFNKKEGKLKEIKRLLKEIRAQKYDFAINLHRFGSSGFITWRSGAKYKIGFDKNPFSFCYSTKIKHEIGTGKHEVERNLSLIKHLGAVDLARPTIFPTDVNQVKIEQYVTSDFYVCAPASVWFTKQLPEHKWVELIERLKQTGKVYLVGGPADKPLCDRIASAAALTTDQVLAGQLSLLDSAALFAQAKRCYVNDSGPLHIASAVNAPTTAFFCATVPNFGFGPLADDAEIAETLENLDCRPCGLHGGKECPKGHFKCGDIEIKKVH